MKSRASALPPKSGLVAWLENTRVELPLKGVECRFHVTGALLCVEIDQIYHQNTNRPMDCSYTFPLPGGAAVYRCELHVNGRVVRAKVEEQATAARLYRERKALGQRAALVQTERANLFTLSLGNVQPEDVIVVRFAWFQVLDRVGKSLRFHVPTTPGIRYIPGKPLLRASSGSGTVDDTDEVPDASRITPPRIDSLHPDAAYFSVEGILSAADVESGTVSSPSHAVYIREKGESVTVELSSRDAVPDRDFVLSWREPMAAKLTAWAWHWTEKGHTYALVQFRAPEDVKVAESFAQDFYFLVDRSGSMAGTKWRRTCEALRAFVGLLGEEDRVWITVFANERRDFAEVPLSPAKVLADRGFQEMEALGTGGGTELLPAAKHVLEKIAMFAEDRRASVVLITDGQVGNEENVMRVFQPASQVRVHAFGIDSAVNDAFLRSLARQQGGGCWLMTPNDDIAGTIAALADRLRRPVLVGLSVRDPWETAAGICLEIYAREVATVALRSEVASPITIAGRFLDGSEHDCTLDIGSAGSEAVRLLWAKERIDALLRARQSREAIALAREHNLICAGAAFIAWDEAEQVPIARDVLVQPALVYKSESLGQIALKSRMPDTYFACPDPADASCDDGSSNPARALPALVDLTRKALVLALVPERLIKSCIAWALGDSVRASLRLNLVRRLPDLFAQMRQELNAPVLHEPVENLLRAVLELSPEQLVSWILNFPGALSRIVEIRRSMRAAGTPQEMTDRLVASTFEQGTFNMERMDQLDIFAQHLKLLPFSVGASISAWRNFRETLDANSQAQAAVDQWLRKSEPTTATPPIRVSS